MRMILRQPNGITVGELRELLRNVPDEALVAVSSDSEGNRVQPAAVISFNRHNETTRRGLYRELDLVEEALLRSQATCVVLWPIN